MSTKSLFCRAFQDVLNSFSTTLFLNLSELTPNVFLVVFSKVRLDQFNFREHGVFSKFEWSIGRKKSENKKSSYFFLLWLWISIKTFPNGIYSDFSKFAFKKCVTMFKLTCSILHGMASSNTQHWLNKKLKLCRIIISFPLEGTVIAQTNRGGNLDQMHIL